VRWAQKEAGEDGEKGTELKRVRKKPELFF